MAKNSLIVSTSEQIWSRHVHVKRDMAKKNKIVTMFGLIWRRNRHIETHM
jgi:hypothetical protein